MLLRDAELDRWLDVDKEAERGGREGKVVNQ